MHDKVSAEVVYDIQYIQHIQLCIEEYQRRNLWPSRGRKPGRQGGLSPPLFDKGADPPKIGGCHEEHSLCWMYSE